MRTLVVGDVHGCRQELEDLLDACGWSERDALVLVGDLVARGPDSAGVVRLARTLKARAVLGNHDDRVLQAAQGQPTGRHHREVAGSLGADDLAWLSALPLWLELPEHGARVVHAGLVPGLALEAQPRELVLNLRSVTPQGQGTARLEAGAPWASLWRGPPHLLFGHDAVRGLQQWPWATGLDTGCVYGKALTALVLPERRLVQVPARKAWAPLDPKGPADG